MWSFHNILAHHITLFEDIGVSWEVHLEGEGQSQERTGQTEFIRHCVNVNVWKCMNKVGEYVHVCMCACGVCVCMRA